MRGQQADTPVPGSPGTAQGNGDFVARLRAADHSIGKGEYADAKTILLAALKEAESFGSQDARTAVVLNNLGTVYEALANT